MGKFDAKGRLIPDKTPVAIPVGFGKPESLQSMITRLVRLESSRAAATGKAETFEEADDFDVNDDTVDPVSPYQMNQMQEDMPNMGKTLERGPQGDPEAREKTVPEEGTEADRKEFAAFLAWKQAQKNSAPDTSGANAQ